MSYCIRAHAKSWQILKFCEINLKWLAFFDYLIIIIYGKLEIPLSATVYRIDKPQRCPNRYRTRWTYKSLRMGGQSMGRQNQLILARVRHSTWWASQFCRWTTIRPYKGSIGLQQDASSTFSKRLQLPSLFIKNSLGRYIGKPHVKSSYQGRIGNS